MAKELFDGIYSSHKLVFMERIERNLKFYLKEKLIDIKQISQEILCVIEKKDIAEVLEELSKNSEIQVEVLNSVNLYQSKNGYCILINLSSIANNYSMILKIFLNSYSQRSAADEYEGILSTIKATYNSAELYQERTFAGREHFDIRLINQSADGMDGFDTYIAVSDERIKEIYFDTRISKVLKFDFYRNLKFTDLLVYLSRFDYNAGIFPEICYCLAIEELIQLKVPKRVQYIRMLISELFRISNHLYFLSKINKILGHDFSCNHALIERERVLRLVEIITGARINPNFIRIGGVKSDLDKEHIISINDNLKILYKKISNLEALMIDNSIITTRLKNLGVVDRDTAIECGATGPNLRVSGMRYDLRKNRNFLLYKDISFLIPAGKHGDCLDRVQIRFREIYQSVIIISQIMKALPDEHIKKILDLRDLDLPYSEMISSIECPHGVFKIFLETEGNKILNLIILGPSRHNLYLAEKALRGARFEDLEVILASFDISCGEVLQE